MAAKNRLSLPEGEICVTLLVKENGQKFIFAHRMDKKSIFDLLAMLDIFKNDPDVDFDAVDEAILRKKVAPFV